MSGVHPDKTAARAVDACGGIYTAAEMSSRFAEGHSAALVEAMKEVARCDALTAELLKALRWLLEHVVGDDPETVLEIGGHSGTFITGVMLAREAIAKATGAAQ
jgi:hypothetical protein